MTDVIVDVEAGNPVDDPDSLAFAAMLLRMYGRWCDRRGFEFELCSFRDGDGGVIDATFLARGEHASAWFASEHGLHRWTGFSPFDSEHRRRTAFAGVRVTPLLGQDMVFEDGELRIEAFRQPGAGGQQVAVYQPEVMVIHLPTMRVARCNAFQSQFKNRDRALELLRARLTTRHEDGHGGQVRTYVHDPHTLVRDLRSEWETEDIERFLDGELLDECSEAYWLWLTAPNQLDAQGRG